MTGFIKRTGELTEASPSTPVKITGLSGLPEAGSEFFVVKSEKEAMEIAEKRTEGQRHMIWAIVGLVIIFGTNSIVGLIADAVGADVPGC